MSVFVSRVVFVSSSIEERLCRILEVKLKINQSITSVVSWPINCKSGSGVTNRHCNNVTTDEATDHVHSEPIEWQEDSIYDRDDSKAKPVILKDGMTIWLAVTVLYV